MKLAISNIAWPAEAEAEIAELLTDVGVTGVEVAPTKVWPKPTAATERQVTAYREFWIRHGVRVVALQALLYGRPELTVFESQEARNATLAHLDGIARVAGWLSAPVMVFGSPRNRQRSGLSESEARAIAVEFFRAAGERAAAHATALCIEANPPDYGCDFVTASAQALRLVEDVAHEGFGLHLDAGAMTLAGEDLHSAITACGPAIRHFHASEPQLGRIGLGGVDHEKAALALRAVDYQGRVSGEMRAVGGVSAVDEIGRVGRFLADVYG